MDEIKRNFNNGDTHFENTNASKKSHQTIQSMVDEFKEKIKG